MHDLIFYIFNNHTTFKLNWTSIEKTQLVLKASDTPMTLNRGHGHQIIWYETEKGSQGYNHVISRYTVSEKSQKKSQL